MIIFINDIPVRILQEDEKPDPGQVNLIVDAAREPITRAKLIQYVWIQNVTRESLDVILEFLNSNVPVNLFELTISPDDYLSLKAYFRSKFKIIKAAGGLIRKKEKTLMIYRMKKWDLPKGKKEKKEKYKQTAVREVEEECNVSVKLGDRICTTWHTYTMNKRPMLKKTRWYTMDLVDDTKMKPSIEEDIEEVRWMTRKEVYHALKQSYKSISYVFERYYALKTIDSLD